MKQIRFWHIVMGGPGFPGAAPTQRIGVRGFVAPSVGPGGGCPPRGRDEGRGHRREDRDVHWRKREGVFVFHGTIGGPRKRGMLEGPGALSS